MADLKPWKTVLSFRSPKTRTIILVTTVILTLGLTVVYRFYQPLTHPALLQFDIFDWARQSREILLTQQLITPTALWVFPVWNAVVAAATQVDLFQVHLYSGAIFTTLNIFILYAIGCRLWPKRLPRLMLLVLYACNTQLLGRSVNWLPETMTFTLGLALIYFYLRLLRQNRWRSSLPAIVILSYLYYHLHQSGLNFLVFSAGTVLLYMAFILPTSKKVRLIAVVGCLALGLTIIAQTPPILQQFRFFLQGSKNSDLAFQGTAIPINQILLDYPIQVVVLMAVGLSSIIIGFFKKVSIGTKISWLVILLITGFYFSFLYILPNLGLYSLVPWRFYTWFSLYGIIIAAHGFGSLVLKLRLNHRFITALVLLFVFSIVHSTVISDNMYTADQATLTSMQHLPIPSGSTVITTNANYLQADYAFVGRNLILHQGGPDFFRSAGSRAAYEFLPQFSQGDSTYILISLYQLRQRPYSIDYWRNAALFDMPLSNFNDQRYFKKVFSDHNVALFAANPRPAIVER